MPTAQGVALAPVKDLRAKKELDTAFRDRADTFLVGLTIALGAFLLFQVQLIIGKYILPWFGGTPAVWNTCMLVFQVLLLAGYAYAHLIATRLRPRWQLRIHLTLLVVGGLTLISSALRWGSLITPGAAWRPADPSQPVWQILKLLTVSIGLPFFLLSTTGPLLQAWHSRLRTANSAYRLYSLSNGASFLALVGYPFLLERILPLHTQAWLWSAGDVAFLIGFAACTFRLANRLASEKISPPLMKSRSAPQPSRLLLWLALPACASIMLLATTNVICQEIAVIPLLWVLPLALYLLSFVLCFDHARWYRRSLFHFLFGASVICALKFLIDPPGSHILEQIAVFSLALFSGCMICHGELVRLKPEADHLTLFYFMISMGGALGGLFVGLVAPWLFQNYWELQLGFFVCAVLMFTALALDRNSWLRQNTRQQILPALTTITMVAAGAWYTAGFVVAQDQQQIVFRSRNFFGRKTVLDFNSTLWLKHGAIHHGFQFKDQAHRDEPTSYYSRRTGIGLLMENYPRESEAGAKHSLRVGLVGLGVGTLAAYGHPGDYFRFYELDPEVLTLSISKMPFFTFVRDSSATVDAVLGDARLSLEREAAQGQFQNFDILVLDAFSSDAIPVHLLTKEATALYLKHLRGPDSVLAFHISNRNLDLRPVLAGLGRAHDLSLAYLNSGDSDWVLLSRNPNILRLPALTHTQTVDTTGNIPTWTDDYSNLFQVLKHH